MNPRNRKRLLWVLVFVIGLPVAFYTANKISTSKQAREGSEPASSAMKMDEGGGSKEIVISPRRIQTLGVTTDTIQYRKLDKVIRTIGRVDYDERLVTTVSSKISGWIEKLYVDYTGKFVTKGAPMYEIYSPEVVSTEQEYLLSLKGKLVVGGSASYQQDASDLLRSAERRLEFWDVPAKHIRELKESRRITKTIMMHTPANGFILEKNVLEGGYVSAGQDLFKIADISRVWVEADIYEYEMPLVEVGQSAELALAYFPGDIFRGIVTYIYPYLEEKTRTVKIRFEFPNEELKLKPGMFANVRLFSAVSARSLAIPAEAVLDTGERQLVFVQKSRGVYEPREVTLGTKAQGYYEVLEGVYEGEIVATSANFLIDSESRLGSAMMKMKM